MSVARLERGSCKGARPRHGFDTDVMEQGDSSRISTAYLGVSWDKSVRPIHVAMLKRSELRLLRDAGHEVRAP